MASPVTWFEIIGPDALALQKFYRDVFGWKLTPPVKEMGNYSMLTGHEPGIGGGIGGDQGDGARVSVYAEVDDPQRYLDRALGAGAVLMMPVTTVTPDTTIAIFRDPAGNVTGILKANPRPAARPAARPRAKATAKRKTATKRRTSARKSGRKTKRAKRR
ncbi:MAG TPA: VOC family protein [Candidatus Limnocylindria bacterium]|nr:VOC family protein [Candidatus Limnocylindria bacterium]